MSLHHALDIACEQAQRYADDLHTERMLRLAAAARCELLEKQLRDVEILLHGKMPMTALDYLKEHRDELIPSPGHRRTH